MNYFWEDYGPAITTVLVVATVIGLGYLAYKHNQAEDLALEQRCALYLSYAKSSSDTLHAMTTCDNLKEQVATRRQEAANAAIIAGSVAGSAASRR